MSEESRARSILFNSLTKVQHRDYAPMVADFRSAIEQDPDFIARACVHIAANSNIRDQQDVAIITLLQSPSIYPEYREAGRVLLVGNDIYDVEPKDFSFPNLPPFRFMRVVDYIRSSDRKIPRLMQSAVEDYFYTAETNPLRFDGMVMRNRSHMKKIYRHYHLKPSPRAQAVLFDNNPPADSKLAVLKLIANEKDPNAQARLVIENKIPYVVATSVLPKISPAVGVALIDVMSPAEALNSRAWVEKSGLLEIPEVRDLYTTKVAQASTSAASAQFRKSAQGSDACVQEAVNKATEKAVSKQQRIQRNTLLMIDKSGSMEVAFPIAQQLGSRIAPLADGEFMCVLFNDYAQVLQVKGNSFADWQAAFRGQRAGGQTSMQAGFERAIAAGAMPEQIIIVTDEGENVGNLARSLLNYEQRTGSMPGVVIVACGGYSSHALSYNLNQAGIRFDRFEIKGDDYYVYDQIAALLGGAPAQSIVERILETPLPYRSASMRAMKTEAW